jgi:hypothetical protein
MPRNTEERQILTRAAAEKGIAISDTIFTYSSVDAPLSWHLSPKDTAELQHAWVNTLDICNTESKNRVREFLAGQDLLEPQKAPCPQ